MVRVVKYVSPDEIYDIEYDGRPCEIKSNGEFLVANEGEDKRLVLFIVGCSGSGKSTYTSKQIDVFKAIVGGKVYFVSNRDVSEDPVFKRHLKDGIQLTDEEINGILENPHVLQDCCVVFDDFFTIDAKDPKYKLLKHILEGGRKPNITCLLVQHQAVKDKLWTPFAVEAQGLVFFPNNKNTSVEYFLTKHHGVNKKLIPKMEELDDDPYRRVCYWLTNPATIITDKLVLPQKNL